MVDADKVLTAPEYTTEPRKGKRVADPEPYEGYEAGYSSDTPTVRSLAEGGEDDPDMQQAIQNSRQSGRQGQASGSRSYGVFTECFQRVDKNESS